MILMVSIDLALWKVVKGGANCPLSPPGPFSTPCSDPCLKNDALKPQLLALIFTAELSLS